jgi:hypothetical protein
MNFHTNELVRKDSVFSKSNSLNNLRFQKKELKSPSSLKLSFKEQSELDLYVIINGVEHKEHLGKSFSITRPRNDDDFFQKLYNTIKEKGNITLLKNKPEQGDSFWSKCSFVIISNDLIKFTAINELIVFNKESQLTKLMNTLNNLELAKDITISNKYLLGFLEERGSESFNEYVQYQM